MMVQLTPEVFVLSEEVCAIEFDRGGFTSAPETTLTLKNGRFIRLRGMQAEEVIQRLGLDIRDWSKK